MFQREVGQIEIHPLQQQIRRAEHGFAVGRHHDGCIVAGTREGGGVLRVEVPDKAIDQAELPQRGERRMFFFRHIHAINLHKSRDSLPFIQN